ncbi:class I SAM-dependent methyltransferase [Methylobacillus sp.]|uniref:class I SAM-dependent methyltransferase n=1 Tax=Methylobacillus sp. TaxID=56818 RepID=UPI00338EBDE8
MGDIRCCRSRHRLNIGCFGIEASALAPSYTGFDNNPDLIEIANRQSPRALSSGKKLPFMCCDFDAFHTHNDRKFDVIFSFAVHVWIGIPIAEYISRLRSMLAPQGILVIECNNLDKNDHDFLSNMRLFRETGFMLLHRGEIIDDGIIRRTFCVLKSLH